MSDDKKEAVPFNIFNDMRAAYLAERFKGKRLQGLGYSLLSLPEYIGRRIEMRRNPNYRDLVAQNMYLDDKKQLYVSKEFLNMQESKLAQKLMPEIGRLFKQCADSASRSITVPVNSPYVKLTSLAKLTP